MPGDIAPGGAIITEENGLERFIARRQPFIKDHCLEQRSRESLQQETRIGFTRPKPAPQGGNRVSLADRRAGGSGSRNPRTHQRDRRDVLNKIQRTKTGLAVREDRTKDH